MHLKDSGVGDDELLKYLQKNRAIMMQVLSEGEWSISSLILAMHIEQ